MIRRTARNARLSDEAIALLVSPDGTARVAAWRARSPAHAEAMAQAEALLNDVGRSDAAAMHRAAHRAQPSATNRRRVLAGGIAAAAAGALYVDRAVMPAAGWFADHVTRVGERRRIALDDGVFAWMNTASALSIGREEHGPAATVHIGEVLFGKAGRPARAFAVAAGQGVVRSRGADFILRTSNGRSAVTALRGALDIMVGERVAHVSAGQAIAFADDVLGTATRVSPIAATAWLRGKLIFQRETVAAIVADMQRYTPGRIMLWGESLRSARLSGVFEIEDPDALFRAIADATGARIDRLPGLTLLHRSQ